MNVQAIFPAFSEGSFAFSILERHKMLLLRLVPALINPYGFNENLGVSCNRKLCIAPSLRKSDGLPKSYLEPDEFVSKNYCISQIQVGYKMTPMLLTLLNYNVTSKSRLSSVIT